MEQLPVASPAETSRLAAPREPRPPYPLHLMGVPAQSTAIACNAVIGVMAPHHLAQMALLFGDAQMQIVSAPVAHRSQRTSEATLRRALPHHVLALPRLHPDMSKTEEVERGPARCRVGLAIRPPLLSIFWPQAIENRNFSAFVSVYVYENKQVIFRIQLKYFLRGVNLGNCTLTGAKMRPFALLSVYSGPWPGPIPPQNARSPPNQSAAHSASAPSIAPVASLGSARS